MKFNIRLLYLYLFSFVGLLITIIGSVQLIDLGLKTYVFKVSEYTYYSDPMIEEKQKISTEEMEKRSKQEQSNQQKRQLSTSLSMILIGVPLYLYHWKTIKKENKEAK
jgi:sortase (surface protein transpeptidase)